jgi:sugar diacid utilization regulator/putative methionine-R-sulfoxide reductase with GAF domain
MRTFLSNKLSLKDYQIWSYSPFDYKWVQVNHQNVHSNPLPDTSIENHTFPLDHQNYYLLDFPENYKVAISFRDSKPLLTKEEMEFLYYLLYPVYSELATKSKEVKLKKLIDGVQNITSTLDLDELLTTMLQTVATVIPGADVSSLWMYSHSIDRLVCRAYIGWNKDIEQVQYKVGESVCGKTYEDGKTRYYISSLHVKESMKGISEKNLQFLNAAFPYPKIHASVIVPISFRNEILGVLSIHRGKRVPHIAKWDLQILKGLSAQIAIAIENARLFTEVYRKNQVLVKQNEVHSTLTQLSIQNKGIETITQELNQMLGLPVMFVDLNENKFYKTSKLNSSILSMDEISKICADKHDSIYVDVIDTEMKSLFIYPILVNRVCYASIVVLVPRQLTQMENIIVERGGSVLALELAKRQLLTEVHNKKIHDFYSDLLKNENPNLLYQQGLEYGIDLKNNLFTIKVELSNHNELGTIQTPVHRFVSRMNYHFREEEKIIFGNNNKVSILFSVKHLSERSIVIKKLNTILTEWEQNDGKKLYAGIGMMYKGIDSIKKTDADATKALTYRSSQKRTGSIEFSEIGINRLFLNLSNEEVEEFLQEIFAPLATPGVRNSDLEQTLLSFIKFNRNAAKTAEDLHIHINTLYQRIKKIEDTLGISLEKPEDLLKMQLAYHLRETFE